jgi:hypothetical protein
MTISATNVHFDEHTMTVDLTDGRSLRVPLAWFPRLLRARSAERAQVELSRNGLHWPLLDEDISIAGLLAGRGDNTKHVEVSSSTAESPAALRQTGTDKRIYVERRPEGDYAVRRANSQRASDVLPTQREAIERARELSPDTKPHVERVRHTSAGSPDKWRTTEGSVRTTIKRSNLSNHSRKKRP